MRNSPYLDNPPRSESAARAARSAAIAREYDAAAQWCARRGLAGAISDPLPGLLSADVAALIRRDPCAFAARVAALQVAP